MVLRWLEPTRGKINDVLNAETLVVFLRLNAFLVRLNDMGLNKNGSFAFNLV